MKPDILYEDNEIIVCKKPAGIPTQSDKVSVPDMISILKNHLCLNGGGKNPYLAVIHRLDQPVEGILVFAKTAFSAKELNRQLTAFGFGKYYRAVVVGTLPSHEGDLTDHLVKDARTNTSRVCTAAEHGAKSAQLHYKMIENLPEYRGVPLTVVEITLKTGRHHQIRVQMAHAGCPVAGDRKYGGQNESPYHTLQLFAYCLSFRHPKTGKYMEFTV